MSFVYYLASLSIYFDKGGSMAHWGWYWKINKKHLLRNWMKKATFMIRHLYLVSRTEYMLQEMQILGRTQHKIQLLATE